MEEVGKAWVLICCVIRSANLADRLNLLFSMSETGLPAPDKRQLTKRQHKPTDKQESTQPLMEWRRQWTKLYKATACWGTQVPNGKQHIEEVNYQHRAGQP